jgi:EpsI family protein
VRAVLSRRRRTNVPDRRRAAVIGLLLAAAAAAAHLLAPTSPLQPDSNRFDVAELAPARFRDWVAIANPDPMPTAQPPEGGRPYPYSQELAITYGNATGERVMLSIAYGRNQLDHRLYAHRPEYCYRAQGFGVAAVRDERLATPYGSLPVRRLSTSLRERKEPVTYWMTISDEAVLPGWSRVVAQVRHGLRGAIPDGILVRVSSIDPDPGDGYAGHDRFVREWLASMPPHRRALLGAGG